MKSKISAHAVALLATLAATGPAISAPAGSEVQQAADAFWRCSTVGRNKFASAVFDSIAAYPPVRQTVLLKKYSNAIVGKPSFETEGEFKTVKVRPAEPVTFANVPVTSFGATTCKGGECGMAVYWLNFDNLGPADRKQLKTAVAKAPRGKPRPEIADQGAKGISVVCDIGD